MHSFELSSIDLNCILVRYIDSIVQYSVIQYHRVAWHRIRQGYDRIGYGSMGWDEVSKTMKGGTNSHGAGGGGSVWNMLELEMDCYTS